SADFTFSRVQLAVSFQNTSICANQYWWDFGDGFYSDDIKLLHFYNEPGTYTVCLKAMDTVTMNYDITCKEVTVFKQQIEPESDWTLIYPNPCREKFWLKASDSLGVDRIKIFSSTGQLVWSEKVDLTVSNPCEISLNLAEAVYHLKGYRDDRVVFRKKLVVLYSH
ncbi:MAG TPA: PKD domain-containing protein, partial [Bacteroidales bacterium]|nr:PKD domain-containing protein [Bacteroidales bacterium]